MSIIADPGIDRNFMYVGKKGVPRETVRQFPVERTDTGEQFLQAAERRPRPSVPLSAYQGYYGKSGQKSIDPVVFFKLCLVGYLENIVSDRKLSDHCSMRLDILYFVGYDIDEELRVPGGQEPTELHSAAWHL